MASKTQKIALVIPCYNEEESLRTTTEILLKKFDLLIQTSLISKESEIFLVDDGSKDKTWNLITELHQTRPEIRGIKLSSNCGHQNAILAGMFACMDHFDLIITMDADLQHDPNTIETMIHRYNEGYEIVFGVRQNRGSEPMFKKIFSELFYKFMSTMGVNLVNNHADYRLIGSKALKALSTFEERNLFLRGIFPILGFKTTQVEYQQFDRMAGVSKYTYRKMLSLALNGITSFSIAPLRFVFVLGLVSSSLSTLGMAYTVFFWMQNKVIQGWSSTVIAIYFLGGVQLISLGIIGEYVGRIYKEVKRRPRYIVENQI